MDAIIFIIAFLSLLVSIVTLVFVLRLSYLAVGIYQGFMESAPFEKENKSDEETGLIDIP